MYVFYLELLTDMLHLVVYLVFFVIVFTNFGLPVHLVRPAAGQRQCLAVLQLVCVKWVNMDLLQEPCLAESVLIPGIDSGRACIWVDYPLKVNM